MRARFVAKGFKKVEGVDFDETFALTLNRTSLRIADCYHCREQLAFRHPRCINCIYERRHGKGSIN